MTSADEEDSPTSCEETPTTRNARARRGPTRHAALAAARLMPRRPPPFCPRTPTAGCQATRRAASNRRQAGDLCARVAGTQSTGFADKSSRLRTHQTTDPLAVYRSIETRQRDPPVTTSSGYRYLNSRRDLPRNAQPLSDSLARHHRRATPPSVLCRRSWEERHWSGGRYCIDVSVGDWPHTWRHRSAPD